MAHIGTGSLDDPRSRSPTKVSGDRIDRSERWYRLVGALLTAVFFVGSLLWALTTPAFDGPDEIKHYNSVSRLLGGSWPMPYEAEVKGSTWQAVGESTATRMIRPPEDVPDMAPVAPGDRSTMAAPTDLEDHGRDQMVQHPPGYYAIAAGAVQLAGGTDLTWDTGLVVMRAVSAALTAASVPFLIGIGRRVTGSRRAGLLGATSLLSIPFLLTLGGYVTNDPFLLLGTSATLYAAVRAVDAPRVGRWFVATGVALGITLLAKGLALLLIPVVGLLGVAAVWRRPEPVVRRLAMLCVPQAVALAVGGWWWVRNLIVLGQVQPSQCVTGEGCEHLAVPDPPPPDLWTFTAAFWDRLSQLFWGRGADQELAYPDGLTTTASIVLVVILVAALLLARRRFLVLALLLVPLMVIAVLYNNAYATYLELGRPDRGVQGRYTFHGAAAASTSVAVLWARAPQGRLTARIGAAAMVLAAAAVAARGWTWVFERLWVREEGTWSQARVAASEAVGTPPWLTVALAVLFCVASVALAAAMLSRRTAD